MNFNIWQSVQMLKLSFFKCIQDRKRQAELAKLQQTNEKQQSVLKRKVEEVWYETFKMNFTIVVIASEIFFSWSLAIDAKQCIL